MQNGNRRVQFTCIYLIFRRTVSTRPAVLAKLARTEEVTTENSECDMGDAP